MCPRSKGCFRKKRSTLLEPENQPILLNFPHLENSTRFKPTLISIDNELDIAILKFPDEPKLPKEALPAPLIKPDREIINHRYIAFGFPENYDDGVWAEGLIIESVAGGRIQIVDEKTTGYMVEPGFSGGPVWNSTLGGVVGIVVQADQDPQKRAAFAIPNKQLVELETSDSLNFNLIDDRDDLTLREYLLAIYKKDIDEEDHFIPLRLRLEAHNSYAESSEKPYDDLSELLEEHNNQDFIIFGGPGSGKTNLLLDFQQKLLKNQIIQNLPNTIALYFPLKTYAGEDPFTWLASQWKQRQYKYSFNIFPTFDNLIQMQGIRFYFLLDGIDEMKYKDSNEYIEHIDKWHNFLSQSINPNKVRVIFTCRSHELTSILEGPKGIRYIHIDALDKERRLKFIEHFCEDSKTDEMHLWLEENQALEEIYQTPFFLRIILDSLSDFNEIPDGQASLITSFVRRSLMRELVNGLKLSDLIKEGDRRQIVNRFKDMYVHQLPEEGSLFLKLSQLAFNMHSKNDKGQVVEKIVQANKAKEYIDPSNNLLAEEVLKIGRRLNILNTDSQNNYFFFHQLFQEYFCARYIKGHTEVVSKLIAIPWEKTKLSPPLETILKNRERIISLISTDRWLSPLQMATEMSDPIDGLPPQAFINKIITHNLPLASHCAAIPSTRIGIPKIFKRSLADKLIERMHSEAADIRARFQAANALGELRDPRLITHQKNATDQNSLTYQLPQLQKIQKDIYSIGIDENTITAEFKKFVTNESLLLQRKKLLDSFQISIFPVTNQEYRHFIDSNGYSNEAYWEGDEALGWLSNWRKKQEESYKSFRPEYWYDKRYNGANQPVVGITWYEARAYCMWLSEMTGDFYRLPTDMEWEIAARGKEGYLFPYGDQFNKIAANSEAFPFGRTTPVGLFYEGKSPLGIYDLVGNVWEWTLSNWGTNITKPEYRKVGDNLEAYQDIMAGQNVLRIARGGSWYSPEYHVSGVSRHGFSPDQRLNTIGFRIIQVLSDRE